MSEPTPLTGPDLERGIEESAVVEGRPVIGHAHGEAVLLVREQGALYAIGASCTHYGGPLGEGLVAEGKVHCPWHHACFDLRTGQVEGPPALNPIACYRIEKTGSSVRVGTRLPAPVSERRRPTASPAPPQDIVIVGAGASGHYAAETLRRRGYEGRLTLLGRDPAAPYDRPNLSKDFLAGNAPEEWIPLRPEAFYAENHITLETGAAGEVQRVDVAGRTVHLAGGRPVPFDRLLLATGAEPIGLPVPGADAPHVHMLRTLADCRRLIQALGAVQRVVLIGGGFIGLEAAAALRARGLDVVVVSLDATPLGRVVGEQVGGFLRRLHEEHGVAFRLGETVARIERDVVVTGSGERIPADLVLVAIGVKPAFGLAEGAGLAVDRGVLVNEYLETSAPGIFASGDAARFPDPRSGRRIRVEHWAVAQAMGAAAARNMLGERKPFTDVPFFWSVHYDVTLSYVGHAESASDVTVDGRLEDRDCRVEYREDGKRAAVLTIGRDGESLEIEREMRQRG
jgi:apoptosis-inducing factor 3